MNDAASIYEKLGVFYLGKEYDLASRARRDEFVLYDAKDLTTHAVCVGMTGSGKTGLCVTLLEEAAIDGIPAIVIDPKGDLGNMLLTFPDLKPTDFEPWVNANDAAKKGLSAKDFAAKQAAMWEKGLGEWAQDGERIRRLKDAADFTIFTPGSNAGVPISILDSFAAPPAEIAEDAELMRDRVSTTATSLLGLIGVDADPIKSREHILLSTILAGEWSNGRDVSLPTLIHHVQNPPFSKVGVMDVEAFFPSKDRFALALQLNNLLAAPGFELWLQGEALDIGALLRTPAGKPRVSIFSIAHLSDSERMFFVSLLFNQILGWVRTQRGTTSLRALVYMDEIAGYFPPVANPPSKAPMLTMMKQARAFGVGMVLATQNPVDIDYKGLSNAGTWFIGRLQTERDKARVLEGLEGAAAQASAKFDRSKTEQILSSLGQRVFYMNNVHDNTPTIFETRWAMSYLCGPLTRAQIKSLTAERGVIPDSGLASTTKTSASPSTKPSATLNASTSGMRPVLPPEIPQYFVPARSASGGEIVYVPMVLGLTRVYYQDSKKGIDEEVLSSYVAEASDGPVAVDWDRAIEMEVEETDLESSPAGAAIFALVPGEAARAKSYDAWKKSLADYVYRAGKLEILQCDELDERSRPGENERQFRARLSDKAREERDAATAKLREKYASKIQTLTDRVRRAEQAVEVQKGQARDAKWSTAMSFGAAVLSSLLGKKKVSMSSVGRATTAMRGVGRSARESGDVDRAEENVDALQQQLKDLEAKVQAEIDEIAGRLDPTTAELTSVILKPKKSNITVRSVVLAWTPHAKDASGRLISLVQ
ncbi:MAG: DUF87 domain-containing protein [Phycisphaerales bacterium]|nr:MAG: DUF87 domain-containing protein [Phycisphaerales bacterium]